MLQRLILKVTKCQLPPPKRLGTVVKKHFGEAMPMSNRIKVFTQIGQSVKIMCNRTYISFDAIVLKLIFGYYNTLAAGLYQVT